MRKAPLPRKLIEKHGAEKLSSVGPNGRRCFNFSTGICNMQVKNGRCELGMHECMFKACKYPNTHSTKDHDENTHE